MGCWLLQTPADTRGQLMPTQASPPTAAPLCPALPAPLLPPRTSPAPPRLYPHCRLSIHTHPTPPPPATAPAGDARRAAAAGPQGGAAQPAGGGVARQAGGPRARGAPHLRFLCVGRGCGVIPARGWWRCSGAAGGIIQAGTYAFQRETEMLNAPCIRPLWSPDSIGARRCLPCNLCRCEAKLCIDRSCQVCL